MVSVPSVPVTNRHPETDNLILTVERAETPFTRTTLAMWQSEDKSTCDIISAVSIDTPAKNTRSSKTGTNCYVFSDGLFRINIGTKSLVVVPKTKTQHVIWNFHDHVLANHHPGWKKTYRAIRQRLYWKGLKNDVRLNVRVCHVCACTKPLNARPADPMRVRTPRQPWEVMSIDLMGAHPRTSKGKSFILVVT